jgi:aspartate carbamoyltransferase regulatory subunit
MVSVKDISKLPNEFENKFKCVYPTCITNMPKEAITPRFSVISRKPLRLKCGYCGRYIDQEQLKDQIDG